VFKFEVVAGKCKSMKASRAVHRERLAASASKKEVPQAYQYLRLADWMQYHGSHCDRLNVRKMARQHTPLTPQAIQSSHIAAPSAHYRKANRIAAREEEMDAGRGIHG
jgi:hypothetical protein